MIYNVTKPPYDSKVLSESSSLTLFSGTQFVHTVIIIAKL